MRFASYTDEDGRNWAVELPDDAPDSDAPKGLPLGPPSLESLGLPLEQEVRLHNALFARQLFTAKDVLNKRQNVFGAVQAAFKVDTEKVYQLYNSVGE